MNSGLERRLARLERRRSIVMAGIAGWHEARLRFRPGPDAWSTLDVLDHLVKVEEVVLQTVRTRVGEGGVVTGRDRVGAWVVSLVMRSPMRVAVPREGSLVAPEPVAGLEHVAARWNTVRRRLGRFAERLTAEQGREAVFAHPRSGAMTFAMALRFVETHLQHHGYQLRRLREASRTI